MTFPEARTDDRVIGTVMVAVGLIGVAVAAVVAAASATLLGDVDDNVEDTTDVALSAIDAAEDSVDVFASVLSTVRSQTDSLAAGLRTAADLLEESRDVIRETADITGVAVPDTLRAVGELFPTLVTAAGQIDDALEGLSSLPLAPDYDPEVPLQDAVAGVETELLDLADQLVAAGADVDDAEAAIGEAPTELRDIATAVEDLDTSVDETDELVRSYDQTLAEARGVATDVADTAQDSTDAIAAVLIALAVVFGVGQIVPIWLGLRLRRGAAGPTVGTVAAPPAERSD